MPLNGIGEFSRTVRITGLAFSSSFAFLKNLSEDYLLSLVTETQSSPNEVLYNTIKYIYIIYNYAICYLILISRGDLIKFAPLYDVLYGRVKFDKNLCHALEIYLLGVLWQMASRLGPF
jgi:hypothetical protein